MLRTVRFAHGAGLRPFYACGAAPLGPGGPCPRGNSLVHLCSRPGQNSVVWPRSPRMKLPRHAPRPCCLARCEHHQVRSQEILRDQIINLGQTALFWRGREHALEIFGVSYSLPRSLVALWPPLGILPKVGGAFHHPWAFCPRWVELSTPSKGQSVVLQSF